MGLTPLRARAPASAPRARMLVAAVLAVGCSGDGGTPPPVGSDVTQLLKAAGDQQAWYFDNPLPDRYGVVALDASGDPVAGVVVSWTVTSGGGTVDPAQVETDQAGVATTTHTLGPSGANQSVSASVPGVAAVSFASTGESPPTSVAVTVGNDFFSPRDVVVQVDGSITWTWSPDAVDHNVTYTGGPSPRPPDSATQSAGSHTNTFTEVARYEYVCTIHAGMEGTVTVVR